eukprot:2934644-Amphidinium_carterae.1
MASWPGQVKLGDFGIARVLEVLPQDLSRAKPKNAIIDFFGLATLRKSGADVHCGSGLLLSKAFGCEQFNFDRKTKGV